jgi:hypothetical protein
MPCSICKEEGHNRRSCATILPAAPRPVATAEPKPVKRTKPKMAKLVVSCPEDVIAGANITKEKRHEVFGQVAGGAGSRAPENFQRQKIVEGTGIECPKTNTRINLRTNELKDISHPNKARDGFDYSEDFDGCQTVGDQKVYVNLKCIVGAGGAQTRSLREVYWFVEGQLNTLKKVGKIYFANILDGDEAADCMDKFEYILSLAEFAAIKNKIYVGDLKGYFDWFKATFA